MSNIKDKVKKPYPSWYHCTCFTGDCKYHSECKGMPCATAINLCDNPNHIKLHNEHYKLEG
jgi:hypothetical protein